MMFRGLKTTDAKKRFLGAIIILAFVAFFANVATRYIVGYEFNLSLTVFIVALTIFVLLFIIGLRKRKRKKKKKTRRKKRR